MTIEKKMTCENEKKSQTLGNRNAEMYLTLALTKTLVKCTIECVKELVTENNTTKEVIQLTEKISDAMTNIDNKLNVIVRNASGVYIVKYLISNWNSKVNHSVKVDLMTRDSRSKSKIGIAEKKIGLFDKNDERIGKW